MDGNFTLECRCEKCGHHESILIGTGWGGPFADDVISDILNGKYGEKWKELFQNTPDAKVDERMELYVCQACRSFRNEINLSIYKPRKPEEIPPEIKKPYWQVITGHRRNNKWLSLRKALLNCEFQRQVYIHRCYKCGKRMHLYKDGELLHCPKCADGWMKEEDYWII